MFFSFASTIPSKGAPLLFLPGWGFDARIVSLYRLFRGRNLILPDSFVNPYVLLASLPIFLQQKKIAKISVAGWSMGAQVALDFFLTNPNQVADLTLISMRDHWPSEELDMIRSSITTDMSAYMRGFYRKCFLGDKKNYHLFVYQLQENYLQTLDTKLLLTGLDYLEGFSLPLQFPEGVAVHMIHGSKDMIAPIKEMPYIPEATCEIFQSCGHMVLLTTGRNSENV